MRVSDLARKLTISTDDLRPLLPRFGVSANTKEIETALALEIFENLKTQSPVDLKKKSAEPKEEEREIMGFFFEDEVAEPAAIEIAAPESEETEPAEDETVVEEEDEEEEVDTDHRPAKTSTKPEAPKKAVVKKEFTPTPVETDAAAKKRSSSEQEAARARWAAAKKSSEKLLNQTVKRMSKEKQKQLTKEEKFQQAIVEAQKIDNRQLRAGETKVIEVADMISVKELGEKIGVSPIRVVAELFKNGVVSNLNQVLDFDTATLVAEGFGCEVRRDLAAVSSLDLLKGNIEKLLEDDPANLVPRPPIVAVMGHVDHGKTTLLDTIRKTNVVAGESGGITQHIGAYQTEINGRKITFLDTPGHEAFTAMRARGARATDIAILVVAADDGVKPQTIEAINHARDAGVPIVVAVTKTDLPGANLERVKSQLAEHELTPSDWGGKVEVVPVSAPTGRGIEQLLEIILLTNDVEPVTGNPNRPAVGTIVESHLDKSLGPIATVLVNTGTLRVGDDFVIGTIVGRVKKMQDEYGRNIKAAEPGKPVRLAGLEGMPQRGVGEILQVLPDKAATRAKADELIKLLEIKAKQKVTGMSQLIQKINSGALKELKVVVKADVEGSLEALRTSLEKIDVHGLKVRIVHGGVGDVTETDIMMAASGGGLIYAFHVKIPAHVAKIAEREGVSIRQHTIIYKILEETEKLLAGLIDPEEIEVELGSLEVRGIFLSRANEQIVGGIVKTGRLENNVSIRVWRGEELLGEAKIVQLKRVDEMVKEVKENTECGLKVAIKNFRIVEGDRLIAYKIEKQKAAV